MTVRFYDIRSEDIGFDDVGFDFFGDVRFEDIGFEATLVSTDIGYFLGISGPLGFLKMTDLSL